MFKKLVLLVAGVALLFAGGCSKKQGGTPGKITLRYSNAEGTADQIKIMTDLCEAFMKENPDIEVIPTYGTTQQKIMIELAADTPPDIFMWWGGLTDLVDRDTLLPLGSYMKKYNTDLNRFFKGQVDFYRFNGDIYAMPLQINTQCIVYNKDMFDKEKVPYPKENWNWQDYYNTAKKFMKNTAKGEVKQQYGSMTPSTFWFILSHGGDLIDFKANKCMIDTKQTKRVIICFMRRQESCYKYERSNLKQHCT